MSDRCPSPCVPLLLLMLMMPALIPSVAASHVERCTISGDPHLDSFGGQSASLAIPCAYRVTHLQVANSIILPGTPYYQYIQVEVQAGNSQSPIHGQYFVSDVAVMVTMSNTTGEPITNTFYTGESLINGGTPWRQLREDEDMQGRVNITYNAAVRQAVLGVTSTSIRVEFRPMNRSEGIYQTLKPGLMVEVENKEVIRNASVKFPNTMCSTFNDTRSMSEHFHSHSITRQFIGLYAVLQHMAYNIPQGDQDPMCPTIMGKYKLCRSEAIQEAFDTCVVMLKEQDVVNCFEHRFPSLHITNATDACLDNVCSESFGAICDQLTEYCDACHGMRSLISASLQACQTGSRK